MDTNMEKEASFSIMEIDIKANILMESLKVKEFIFGEMALFIKDSLKMALDLVTEYGLTVYKNIKAHT